MQLEENLLAEGCRDALVVWGTILVDGHNRLRICKKHNLSFAVTERDFPDKEAAMRYIILNQFGRRNLSVAVRSILALKLEPLYEAEAKNNQKRSPGRGKKGFQNSGNLFCKVSTDRDIAQIAGVSHDTINRVRKIIEQGTPEQINKMKGGGKGNSVHAIYKEVRNEASMKKDLPIKPNSQQQPDDTAKQEELHSSTPAASSEEEGLPEVKPSIPHDPPNSTMEQYQSKKHDSEAHDIPDSSVQEDDLQKIRQYVKDLKNPNIDRTFTTAMFFAEYEAFVELVERSLEIYDGAPYEDIYPLLSKQERERLVDLNTFMIESIKARNQKISPAMKSQ